MKKHLLALTISSLFAISANAAVSGCPSGWVKSTDGKECVLTEKVDTPAIGTSDTTRPICINGFTYESATNKCSKTVSANTNPVNKINAYQGALVFGTVREIVNGSCGTAKNTYSYTQPSGSALCSPGVNSGVSLSNNTWTWSCAGAYTGSTDHSCLTYKKVDGVCGSANGKQISSAPSGSDLCSIGNPTTVTGNDPWRWFCQGINQGKTSSECSAIKSLGSAGQCIAGMVVSSISSDGSASYSYENGIFNINSIGSSVNWGQKKYTKIRFFVDKKNLSEFSIVRWVFDNLGILYINNNRVSGFPFVGPNITQIEPWDVYNIPDGAEFYTYNGNPCPTCRPQRGIVSTCSDWYYGEYKCVNGQEIFQANRWERIAYKVNANTFLTPETGWCYSGSIAGDYKFRDASGTDYISSCAMNNVYLPVDLRNMLVDGYNEITIETGNGIGPWGGYVGIKATGTSAYCP